ncbi:MAG: GNAT family N-acetyltransferase [Clostridiales bacterium]|nr:GNAT family N-acetyltransferase [Clostridiales bacterium]
MTNAEILQIAMTQSAIDSNCRPEDFRSGSLTVVPSKPREGARNYLELPFFCDLATYGTGLVASVDERIVDFITDYCQRFPAYRAFETPAIHLLTKEFEKYGAAPCFMAEYFLPDLHYLAPVDCPYPIRMLYPEDFTALYTKEWSNALCEKRKQYDRIAAAAYDGDTLIGLAGASADCEAMWQIGIDVLPAYRRQGIASALTARVALEILQIGKVPFYCCAWSNIASARNAVRAGFRPSWVQLTSVSQKRIRSLLENE